MSPEEAQVVALLEDIKRKSNFLENKKKSVCDALGGNLLSRQNEQWPFDDK